MRGYLAHGQKPLTLVFDNLSALDACVAHITLLQATLPQIIVQMARRVIIEVLPLTQHEPAGPSQQRRTRIIA